MSAKISISKVLLLLLSLAIGGFFLFSAYSKTVPIEYFEYTISSQMPVGHSLAAIAARFFIGLEAALGLLLVICVYGRKKWILKSCLGLLLIFTIHLIVLWIRQGNDVNCGCMGRIAPMSPPLSIVKNIALIAGILVLLRYSGAEKSLMHDLLALILLGLLITIPYVKFPISQPATLPLTTLLYHSDTDRPTEDLRQGKHVLCLMSLTCSHCRHAAGLIHAMVESNPTLPFYFLFPHADNDTTEAFLLKDFMNETHDRQIPHSFVEYDRFVDMIHRAGQDGVPTILWLDDTTIIRRISIPELNQKELEQWLRQ